MFQEWEPDPDTSAIREHCAMKISATSLQGEHLGKYMKENDGGRCSAATLIKFGDAKDGALGDGCGFMKASLYPRNEIRDQRREFLMINHLRRFLHVTMSLFAIQV